MDEHRVLGATIASRPVGLPSPTSAPDDIEAWHALATLAACHDLALQVSHMATFELDAVSGALTWSPNAGEVLGCNPVDIDTRLRDLLAPIAASPPQLGADFELEQGLVTAHGDERFVLVRARSWHAQNHGHTPGPSGDSASTGRATDGGGRDGLFGAVVDVTDRRMAERNLVDLIDRYRLLIELSPDGITVHEGGVLRYVNAAGARLLCTTPEAMIGRSILDFIHPGDIEPTLARIVQLTEPGMVTEPSIATLITAEGNPVRLESVSVLTSWEGRPAFQVILRDISERERADAALRSQASLVEAVSDAIFATDDSDRITSWNPAAERIFGWQADEVLGQPIHHFIGADRLIDGRHIFGRLGGRNRWSGDLTLQRKDGRELPVHASLAVLRQGDDGTATGTVIVCSDQSVRQAAEAERARAEARFSTVVAALDEGIAVLGADGRIFSINGAAARILGMGKRLSAAALLTGRALDPRVDGDVPLPAGAWPVQVVFRTGEAVSDREFAVHRLDGTRVWVRMNVHPLPGSNSPDESPTVVCSFSDVTEQRASAEALSWAATHDPLTGLPNRSAMQHELEVALRANDASSPVGVLFCDLDRFKDINDSLGHRVGDKVLCEVAARLRRIMRGTDMVGRLGGDEFIIICTDIVSGTALRVAERIIEELSQPFLIQLESTTMSVTIGASVGAALADPAGPTPTAGDLLQAADVAMFRAKARGRNRVEVFDASLRDMALHRLETQEDLRHAIETGSLEVHYQPLWRADGDAATYTVAGVEALARWTHPTRGPQSPTEFVALAEETGLISALGTYVLHKACAQTAAWRAEGHDLYVSVNLSARQLSDVDLVPMVLRTLRATGLPASALWLELTESALADEAIDAAAVLGELVALGIRISIDDFGTGYSSLGRLRHYPVAALKVDRSFVADMTEASAADGVGDGGAIVESSIALAHRLGLAVIAEGVETAEQLALLDGLDCDLLQGYLLGRPVPAEEVPLGTRTV